MSKKNLPLVALTPTDPVCWRQNAIHYQAAAVRLLSQQNLAIKRIADALKTSREAGLAMTFEEPLAFGGSGELLFGMAIELLLKGIWLCKHSDPRMKVPKWWRGKTGHDVLRLAKSIKISLEPREIDQLKYLTDEIVWVAKYPAGFADGLSGTWKKTILLHHGFCLTFYERLMKLFDREYEQYTITHGVSSIAKVYMYLFGGEEGRKKSGIG
jgi:hypothetical protein